MVHSPSDDSDALTEFFNTLEKRSIPYCVMGKTDSLPQVPANDVDIVCDVESCRTIEHIIMSLARQRGGHVAQVLRHESGARYYVLHLPISEQTRVFLKLDVCSDYVIGGRLFLSAAWLLEGRSRRGRPFFTAAPAKEFAYYFLKKVAKGSADEAALRHLLQQISIDREGCRAVLDRYLPQASALQIERAIATEDLSILRSTLPALRRELYRRLPSRSSRLFVAEIQRWFLRILQPTGFVAAVLGPDGAGKGTLLTNIASRLSALGRGTHRFHLMPPIAGRRVSVAVVDDPHGRPPRSVLVSTLKLCYFALAYNIGWVRSVWLQRRRSGIIFFDRYYHDLIADPRRYRSGAPPWLVRLVGRLIPMPDLFLILDASPETVRQRKTEVSAEESVRQFGAYRKLCAELPNAHLIDASLPPDKVALQCEDVIVRAMAARLDRRRRHATA